MAVLELAESTPSRTGALSTGLRRWLLALGAYLLFYASWQALRWIPARQELVGDLAFLPLNAAAVYWAWRTAGRCSGSPPLRQAWQLVAAAVASYMAGNLVQLVYEVGLDTRSYPSLADAFYFGVYPLMLAAMLRFPSSHRLRDQTAELVLDLAIVALGTSTVFVYVVLGPGAVESSSDTLQTVFSVAFPACDMILLVGLVSVLLRGVIAPSRAALQMIAVALVVRVAADLVYGYVALHGTYRGGDPADILPIVGLALFATAPWLQRDVRTRIDDSAVAPTPVVAQSRVSWLPYAAVAIVFGLFAVAERRDPFFPNQVLAGVAMSLAALVAVRQLLVQRRLLATQVELRHARDELSALATTDALTGLANHRSIVDALDLELLRARRHGHHFSLLFLDLDHFKQLNDSYGHLIGDEALHELGEVLLSCLRGIDSVGRWGGEEFVVVLPESDRANAVATAERIRTTVMEHRFSSGATAMTCSIGVASYPEDATDRSTLVELADTAMYQAKRQGRNCTVHANKEPPEADGTEQGVGEPVPAGSSRLPDAETRALYLAEHDMLTGLYNRGRLTDEIDRRLRTAAQSGRSGAVLLIDVDNFKLVNDSYGHSEGDRLLKIIAELIRSALDQPGFAARLGSDEFAVILSDTTEGDAILAGNQIRRLLHDRVRGPGVQSSVGVCLFGPREDLSSDDVMIGADIALYEAKEQGGDRTEVYRGHGGTVLTWVDRIWTALAENRFVLYGQPIVALGTGEVVRRELLIRMISEDGDVISPDQFLPTAERFGIVTAIDRWVTDEALAIAASGEPISFNLSAASIGDSRILTSVREAVSAGLDPGLVLFEVTETAAMTNLEAARAFAADLTSLGCDLALDDFGTGFGSFTYLKHLPARYLKIDMEFVRDLAHNVTDQEVVQAICAIARSLRKQTIAEGVETAEVRSILMQYGVDFAQGYFIGRPKRISQPTDLERRLRERTLHQTRRRPGSGANHDAAAGPRSR